MATTLRCKRFNISSKRGDTWDVRHCQYKRNGVIVDISTATMLMEVRLGKTVMNTFTIGSGITVVDGPNGFFDLDARIWDTVGSYTYDLQVTIGAVVKTIMYGDVNIYSDVSGAP